MLLAVGGITAAVGLGFVVADVTAAPAWIAVVIGGALATAGYVGGRNVMKQVRYRITVSFAGLWLLLVLAGAIAAIWLAGSLNLISGLGGKRLILVVVAAALVFYLSTSTLFNGDCFGLRFRKTLVRWNHISQVVFTAGSKPGTVEIGARLPPGAAQNPTPAKAGRLLTDLPFRTVVGKRKFDLDRLQWVLDQAGRQDITLVERTAAGARGNSSGRSKKRFQLSVTPSQTRPKRFKIL